MKWLPRDNRPSPPSGYNVYIGRSSDDRVAAFRWSIQNKSLGHFYYNIHTSIWWFEREEDLVMFTLRWAA